MVAQLRWILLGLSGVLLIGIWWWGARRSRQSPGSPELRETAPPSYRPSEAESREWGVPPLEPLSIRTADFEDIVSLDRPMVSTPEPLMVVDLDAAVAAAEVGAEPAMSAGETAAPAAEPGGDGSRPMVSAARIPTLSLPVLTDGPSPVAADSPATAVPSPPPPPPPAPAQGANTAETQRIVTVRVSALEEQRWGGRELLAALDAHGLAHGRYKVFHRKHSDGRTLFCAASLVEPGTFDLARMPAEEFRGLTLFAVLPGPADAVHTVDALVGTAIELAETLSGVAQDAKGGPLTVERVQALREDVALFQASLPPA